MLRVGAGDTRLTRAGKIPLLIGTTGKKYSGKDTAADYIAKKYNFVKYSLSEPLKSALQILFKFTDEQLHTDLKEQVDPRYGKSPRQIMQHIGTDVLRKCYGDDFFLNHINLNEKIIIADVRFKNERDFIKRNGGIIIKINRDTGHNDAHESENNNIESDFVIDNNGSKEELFAKLDQIILLHLQAK
jgi:dephospho-CoA kinase